VNVDPPEEVGVCVIVDCSTDWELCVVGVCDVEEGVDDDFDEKGVEEAVDDCDVDEGVDEELGIEKLLEEENAEESEELTEVGLVLAIELEDTAEELDGAEVVGAGVEDGAREDGVLVELEADIVNCLRKTSLPGCL
jgi:hypothetical protein